MLLTQSGIVTYWWQGMAVLQLLRYSGMSSMGVEGHRKRRRVQSETCAAQDGVLSDGELNDFQVHCFAVPLQPEELAGVKAVVSQKMPEVRRAMSSDLMLLPMPPASFASWPSKQRRHRAHAAAC